MGPTLIASALRSLHDLSPGGLSPGWISDVGSTRGLAIPHQGSRAAQASSSARTVGTCLCVEVRTGELNEEGLPNDLEAEVRRARGLDASDPSEFE
jgi:hypothetical protein